MILLSLQYLNIILSKEWPSNVTIIFLFFFLFWFRISINFSLNLRFVLVLINVFKLIFLFIIIFSFLVNFKCFLFFLKIIYFLNILNKLNISLKGLEYGSTKMRDILDLEYSFEISLRVFLEQRFLHKKMTVL